MKDITVLSDFLEEYRTFTMRGAKNKREKLRATARRTFEKQLNFMPTALDIQVTDIDEVAITEDTKTVIAIINNISDNDQSALDEKEIYLSVDINADVGCYCFFDNCYWLMVFKEHKEMNAYNLFTLRRCNQILNYMYDGKLYKIPLSIENLTMYSDGINDIRYTSTPDAKRHVWYGSNPITRTIDIGTRIMLTRNTTFRITHVNDFEYNGRYSGADGLIKSLVLQTVGLSEDDKINGIAYNPQGDRKDIGNNELGGLEYIYLGEKNKYSIKTDKEIEFLLDSDYMGTKIIEQNNNECTIEQKNNLDYVGDNVMLIARDKETKETVQTMVITIRGV